MERCNWAWLPNGVSCLRGILSIILFVCALQHKWLAAAVIAALAFATDALDGWLAYWLDARSDLGGRLIDPANDTLLSLALIAGLFVTGIIGYNVLWLLAAAAVMIWIPIIFLYDHWWRAKFVNLSRYYYVAVVILFTAIYFYLAIGSAAAWLGIPAIILLSWVALARDRRMAKTVAL